MCTNIFVGLIFEGSFATKISPQRKFLSLRYHIYMYYFAIKCHYSPKLEGCNYIIIPLTHNISQDAAHKLHINLPQLQEKRQFECTQRTPQPAKKIMIHTNLINDI